MNEIELKFVGNNEDIENGENFNNIIMNNLPISYFPLNNKSLFDKLKNNNNEILSGGIDITSNILPSSNNIITIQSSNFPYKILIKKNIKCKINLDGISSYKNYNLNPDIYTFLNLNNYNIILKNNKEFDKSTSTGNTSISIDLLNENNKKYVKNIIINPSVININNSTGLSIEDTYDNPDYKLLVYKTITGGTLKLNNDIICDILLVGGGGGGGINKDSEGGGGGGGGEVCIANSFKLSSGTYNIDIGIGGNYKPYESPFNVDGNAGGTTNIIKTSPNTTILSAIGGGGGGSTDNTSSKLSGGSGGGASGHSRYNKGGITTKQTNTNNVYYYGNNGGNGFQGRGGGGGGGAGSAGLNPDKSNGGNGGNGILSTITGQNIYYGGGGGGGSGDGGKSGGIGGKGGGGNGANRTDILKDLDGETNTGGGGGGSSIRKSGGGGSGIVIIRINKEYIENSSDINILTNNDTRIITEISNELNKKIIEFNNNEKPYNYLGIIPLVILIIIIWIFIFLFLLKFVHHYLANIYLYILLFIIIFLLIFESIWFLYTNNDIL